MCDHNLRFLCICVAGPGKYNDLRAFDRCGKLKTWLHTLPPGYFVVADNAYPLSEKILVPFKGRQKEETYNSSYNFYLSQMRIRIEMAFGRITTKFRIMRSRMSCNLSTQSQIINAVCRLHIFVIDADGIAGAHKPLILSADGRIQDNELQRFGVQRLPGEDSGNNGFLSTSYETEEDALSDRRGSIVEQRRQRTIERSL